LAERESWRKEVIRPVYHIHKWWANRLGSVFRAILLSSFSKDGAFWERYYKRNYFRKIVFDPFMGSGTTIGEAVKLGCRAIFALNTTPYSPSPSLSSIVYVRVHVIFSAMVAGTLRCFRLDLVARKDFVTAARFCFGSHRRNSGLLSPRNSRLTEINLLGYLRRAEA
jgi:hypothetical protein